MGLFFPDGANYMLHIKENGRQLVISAKTVPHVIIAQSRAVNDVFELIDAVGERTAEKQNHHKRQHNSQKNERQGQKRE